jgi:hypothetical protein
MITSLLPAWPETRICLRLRQHGLNPVHLVRCLFLLSPPFLCVAYSCVVVDKKDHTTGAIQLLYLSLKHMSNCAGKIEELKLLCH